MNTGQSHSAGPIAADDEGTHGMRLVGSIMDPVLAAAGDVAAFGEATLSLSASRA